MAYTEYGNTWWGARWLDSLTQIDYSNRIPRGKRYARNGSVLSIKSSNGMVEARVQGTRATPYKIIVGISQYTKADNKRLIDLIRENPYYLGSLQTGELPPELEQECMAIGIKLFPQSWKDLGMQCSCPDWAVPCKHLAAVIYMIANEIDKDPFLIFRLHGLDVQSSLLNSGSTVKEQIPTLDSLTLINGKGGSTGLGELDLQVIPDMKPVLERVLTEAPLFAPQYDFKRDYLSYISSLAKQTTKFVNQLEIPQQIPSILYDECKINYQGKTMQGVLKQGKGKLAFSSQEMDGCLSYLQSFPIGSTEEYPPVLSLLLFTHNFALRLLQTHGAIPRLLDLGKDQYILHWIPAYFNPEIKAITDSLTARLQDKDLVFIDSKPADKLQQIFLMVSLFVRSYSDLFVDITNIPETDEHALFFAGAPYRIRTLAQRGNPLAIHHWLGRLMLTIRSHRPVLWMKETEKDTFQCTIQVKEADKEPIDLSLFLSENTETAAMLQDLSYLGTYFNPIQKALMARGSTTVTGDEFLDAWFNALPALKALGVSMIIPRSLQKTLSPRVSVRMSTSSGGSAESFLALRDLLDVSWTIVLGEDSIDPETLQSMLDQGRKYVAFKDQYVLLDEKEIGRINHRLEKSIKLSPLDLLKAHLLGTYDEQPVMMEKGVQELFGSLLQINPTPVPSEVNASLRPYQERGFQWLMHNHAIGLGSLLADDMGLGKTIQVITFLVALKNKKIITQKKPVLIVVPASLMTNWEHEISRFAPSLSTFVYHGQNRQLEKGSDCIITTYATVRRDSELLQKTRFSVTILDEAQAIKNRDSAQAKSVSKLKSDHSIAMTGTPVENRMLDYWSIIDCVMKGYLGNQTSFKSHFAIPIERYHDQAALKAFRSLTKPLMLRRVKTDTSIINDLPEKLVLERYANLSLEQKVLYKGIVEQTEKTLQGADGIEKKGSVFKLMTALKQVCCHPALYCDTSSKESGNSGKTTLLMDLLESIHQRNEKVLVFTQYAQMGFLLQELLKESFSLEAPFLHGGSTRTQRDAMVKQFQSDPECWLMLLSIRAGGTGLNLTSASHVIHYDLWWNPAVENQATDRAFRIGQDKQVTVHRLITEGTFEERINDMLTSKKDLADSVVSAGENWITELSTEQLKELIELRESHTETAPR
ncbi:SNF2-related protein [uncultured Sphaerochaeta sp.]|uniref:SNF2-related protein n=1 Tax=uncultured Sphaerochaeta sp. TaxID=886478 RepID=UPI002A0A1D49|nr:SNF2-related protein [uncultured Sphaerochaeta sp.]